MEPVVKLSLEDARTIFHTHVHGGIVGPGVADRLLEAIADAERSANARHDHTKCHSPSAADDYTGNCPDDAAIAHHNHDHAQCIAFAKELNRAIWGNG